MAMTGIEIKTQFFANVPLFMAADTTYALPLKSYLIEEFGPAYAKYLDSRGVSKWTTRHDCDNFAWRYYIEAQDTHYKSTGSVSEGLAVGVCYFLQGAGLPVVAGGHAINFAIVDDRKLIFIEPQSQQELILTEAERASIWFGNI